MTAIWFGKHKGSDVEELPRDYLEWLVDKLEIPVVGHADRQKYLDFMSEVEDELAYRKKHGGR